MFITTLLLWLAYIATMKMIGDIRNIKKLVWYKRLGVYAFVAFDVFHNYFIASFMFFEPPDKGRPTLSERLRWILYREPVGNIDIYWRKPLAKFMCKYMVEPWDFGHCSYK